MSIELKIVGDHVTDIVAEVQNLAGSFGIIGSGLQIAETSPVEMVYPAENKVKYEEKTETKKTLSRKEQDVAVREMIEAGSKDDRFEMLTKGRRNEVEDSLNRLVFSSEPEVQTKENDDVDDMFSDEESVKTVTREEVSALMGKVGKDKTGNPIQARLLKIRAVLVDHIPEGEEIKVRNIPEDKLAVVYSLIEKIED